MNCVDARQLFSPWLDGELDEASAVALRLHLEGCGECSRELALWEDMSQALRQARPDVAAPSGFAEGVMARLRDEAAAGEPRKAKVRFAGFRRWREFLAVAAAAAVLVFGWWAVKPDVPHRPGEVAHETEKPPAEVKTADSSGSDGSGSVQQSGNASEPSVKPGSSALGPENGAASQEGQTAVVNPGQTSAPVKPSGTTTQARVFLNKERKITSTLVRLSVADLGTAQSQAENIASRFGVKPELVAQQSAGSDKLVVYRVLVEPGKAEALEDAVMGLGKVVDYQEETRDVTQEFARTLEQYRGLVAQLAATEDASQKRELEAKIKDLEEQLVSWDNASSHRVIVLWLQ